MSLFDSRLTASRNSAGQELWLPISQKRQQPYIQFGGSGRCILLRRKRGCSEGERRQTRLHSQSLDQKPRTQTPAEKALVPQRPEVAHRMRGTHQRGQTAQWPRPLPLRGLRRNEPLGRVHNFAIAIDDLKQNGRRSSVWATFFRRSQSRSEAHCRLCGRSVETQCVEDP
jgi:hypothetical protein